jgi:hypothetical protein
MHMTNRSTQKQHLIVTNMHISLRLEACRQITFKDAEKGLVEEGFHGCSSHCTSTVVAPTNITFGQPSTSTKLSTLTAMAMSIFLLRIRDIKSRLHADAFIFRVKDIQLAEVIDAKATMPNVEDALRAPVTATGPQLHGFLLSCTTIAHLGDRHGARAAFPNPVAHVGDIAFPNLADGSWDSVAAPKHRDAHRAPISVTASIATDDQHLNWALGAPIAAVAGQLHTSKCGVPNPLDPAPTGAERAASRSSHPC